MPSATRESSSPRCRSGGGTGCSPSRSTSKAAPPQGYSKQQPWHNSAIEPDGTLRADYLGRLERVILRADELGMVVILGYVFSSLTASGPCLAL